MSDKEGYGVIIPIDKDHEMQVEVELSIREFTKWIKIQVISDSGERIALSEWVRVLKW